MKSLFQSYSRLLIDNHISDLRPEYMSKFEPARYVEMVELAGVESAMVYSCDHNGNCYYPTHCGHFHRGCQGRDIFGETVALLRQKEILPVAYYTVIYHREAAEKHPQWRCRDANNVQFNGRYHYCCPNNQEYVEFTKEQIGEVLAYPIGGIFVDMSFWPQVCRCPACEKAYGKPIPMCLDWHDPSWVEFQRWREKSMADFAGDITAFIRERRPDITITHQFSPVLHGWLLGQSQGIADASDYSSGDFYGGALQQRLGTKVFAAYSKHLPFEFMTSRCESLRDHTSTKSDEELFIHAATSLANGGAYFFIDAINPDGTLSRPFYERLHNITQRLRPYKELVARHHPEPVAKVGLYFSMKSQYQPERSPLDLHQLVEDADNMGIRGSAMLDEVLGSAAILNEMHVPYRIVRDSNVSALKDLQALIVNHATMMSQAEVAGIREFVANGGVLVITGDSSLQDETGRSTGNFQLAEVMGVDYTGSYCPKVNYLATNDGDCVLCATSAAPLVSAHGDTQVLGRVALPDFTPRDPDNYASIHSDPPGEPSQWAGWSEHQYGKGRCIYLFSGLLAQQQHSQKELGRRIFQELPGKIIQAPALHPAVEVTLLRGQDGTLLLNAVAAFQPLPNPALYNQQLRVQLPLGFQVGRVTLASNGNSPAWKVEDGWLEVTLDILQDVEMIEITHA